MDLKQLEYLVMIDNHHSITRAASELYITQSGLNQQLLKLEKEVGMPLFFRSKHGLFPTQAGSIYLENAKRILQIQKENNTRLRDLAESATGELKIGITYEHGVDMFINIFPKFYEKYPYVAIKPQECIVRQQQMMIANGQLDLGFVLLNMTDRTDDEYLTIFHEDLVLGVHKSHPLAYLAALPGQPLVTVDLSQFKNDRYSLMFPDSTMRDVIDPLFEAAGFKPNLLFESSVNHALFEMVRKGLCCTIIPRYCIHEDENVVWFKLNGNPGWDFAVTYAKGAYLSNAGKYLIKLAAAYGKTIVSHEN
ncbi:MAG: LysR family transcriptional regulator [Oscillospiraceae bacterium]